MSEEVNKLTEVFRYGLIATEYYRRAYRQCKKDMMNNIKKKHDLVDIDEMCDGVAKEYGQE